MPGIVTAGFMHKGVKPSLMLANRREQSVLLACAPWLGDSAPRKLGSRGRACIQADLSETIWSSHESENSCQETSQRHVRCEENASVLELHSFLDVKRISSKVLRGGHLLTAPYVETTPQPSRPTETTDGRALLMPFLEIRGQQSHVQEKGLENQPVTRRQ
ncbi:uncharacterized protein RSE6_07383 [Rhynchosporium secalis]|uniref:Uncharacterized protein n=1 Tax=Rhynchosporium secalis TaxID=38038 RepID=A0A1E1MCS1_RHYSE|nr:uncharacterized protein RSE6_07383 [Rhynchosporium secalis]